MPFLRKELFKNFRGPFYDDAKGLKIKKVLKKFQGRVNLRENGIIWSHNG